MKKSIRDPKGRPLILETFLGRGSYGEVWEARPEKGGEPVAAKLPITLDTLGASHPTGERTADLCARMIREQGRILKRLPDTLRPDVYGIVDGGGAVPCLLMDLVPGSLSEVFRGDLHFVDLLDLTAAIARALPALHDAGQVHGNLKPGNIFLQEDGTARFTDPATETGRMLMEATELLPGWGARLPPEVMEDVEAAAPLTHPGVDTFALGKLLYQAVVAPTAVGDPRRVDGLFVGALDKSSLKPFSDALEERFERDQGNPHTRELFLRRANALIGRILSQETSPSPPYRFYRAAELAQRLEELRGLFHPSFEQMGPVVLDRPPGNEVFLEGEDVRFSLAFKCQGGLTNPDLLNILIYVRDIEREEKVRDLEQEVLPVHDGSRFRCEFRLRGLGPGQFLVRVGLGIKGTPGKPIPRDVMVSVEPAPAKAGLVHTPSAPRAVSTPSPFDTPAPLPAPASIPEPTVPSLVDTTPTVEIPRPQEAPRPSPAGVWPTVSPVLPDEPPPPAQLSLAEALQPEAPPARPKVEVKVHPSAQRAATVRAPRPTAPTGPVERPIPKANRPEPVEAPPEDEERSPDHWYREARAGVAPDADGAPGGSPLPFGLSNRSFLIAAAAVFVLTLLLLQLLR